MRRALCFALSIALLCWSKEAWLSGAHMIRFLEPSFLYEHEELSRKIFDDERSSDAFFEHKIAHSTRVFRSALPKIERLFAQARARGLPLEPLSLRALTPDRALEVPDSAEALRLASTRGAHPQVRLSLDRGPERHFDDHLVVQLGRALNAEQARWLWDQLPALGFFRLEADEAAIAKSEVTKPPPMRSGFGAMRMGKRFGLWVGSTEEIRPEHEAGYHAQADELADELFPQLEAAFRDPARLAALVSGDAKRLISLEQKLGRKPAAADRALFNPYGPLSDGLGMRARADAGLLHVHLLFVVDGPWGARPGDPQLSGALGQYLQRLIVPPAERVAEIDRRLARAAAEPDHRGEQLDELVRLAKEPALRTVGGQQVIDALARRALDTGADGDGMGKASIEALRWIDVPERDRVYFELLRVRRHEPVMSVISQSFGERPDERRVQALIEVLRDPAVSEDSRRWAVNGLRTAINYCKTAAQAPLKARIEQALAGR